MTPDLLICRNIQFDRKSGNALIIGHDCKVYFAEPRVARGLMDASAADLAAFIGAACVCDGRVITGFRNLTESERERLAEHLGGGQLATAGESESDLPRPMGSTPAIKIDHRVILDRYGIAIEVRRANDATEQLEAIAYPLTRCGAMSPKGTTVTRWTPELLDEINRVLGTEYTFADFGIEEEDDGLPI
jgi:hypothetical protein